MKKIVIFTAVLLLAAGCNKNTVYDTQQACEKATGKSCVLELCDIPPCPSSSNKGWQPDPGAIQAELGQEVSIKLGETVAFKGAPVTLIITGFYNHPCPKGAMCFWSGLDVFYELNVDGRAYIKDSTGVNTSDFPYRLTVRESDYQTFAKVVVAEKQKDYSSYNTYYSPPKFGFSIKYPDNFGFNTDLRKITPQSYIPVCDEGVKTVAGCIYYAGNDYSGTNFGSAGVEVSIIKNLKSSAECYSVGTTEPKKVSINGVEFAYAEQSEGAAGHFSGDKIYRSLKGGDCYQLRARVTFANFDNYEPGTIKKFSSEEVWQKLQDIIGTFRFVDNPTEVQ